MEGCEIALLTDVSTGTCLLSACALDVGQEVLAGLCTEARHLLTGCTDLPETLAIRASPLGLQVYLRNAVDQSEAICMVFSPTARIDGVEEAARDFLRTAFEAECDA